VVREVDQLLVERIRFLIVLDVLLDLVQQRGTMLPGHGQAVVTDVGGVGQASDRNDVIWQSIIDVQERLGLMDVSNRKGSKLV
jgi:hypothetical protein